MVYNEESLFHLNLFVFVFAKVQHIVLATARKLVPDDVQSSKTTIFDLSAKRASLYLSL